MRSTLALHAALIWVSCYTLAAAAGTPVATADTGGIETWLDGLLSPWDDQQGPGLVVAASRDGSALFTRAYGLADVEHGVPNSPTTRFNAGSISKTLTAYALLKLEASGSLSLNDRLEAHLDGLPKELTQLTLRQLLQHTAGIKDDWTLASLAGWETSDLRSHEQARRLILRQEGLNFAAGSAFGYSNSGYVLLADVITKVSGQPYADWVTQEILTPLGLTETVLPSTPRQLIAELAEPYEMHRAGPRQTSLLRSTVQSDVQGAGNLVTSVTDLLRFGVHLLHAELAGMPVIERLGEQAELPATGPSGYGLGLQVGRMMDTAMLHHGGSLSGFRSHLLLLPEFDLVVVVLANVNNVRPAAVATQIASHLLGPTPEATADSAGNANAEPLKLTALAEALKYRGRYLLETGRMLTVEAAEGRLYLMMGGSLQALVPDDDHFVLASEATPVRFEQGEDGRMSGLTLDAPGHRLEARRIEPLTVSDWDARQYSGRYYSAALDTHYDLRVVDHRLIARRARGDDLKFTAIGDDHFLEWEPGDLMLTFERNRRGRVEGFRLSAHRARNVAFVRE